METAPKVEELLEAFKGATIIYCSGRSGNYASKLRRRRVVILENLPCPSDLLECPKPLLILMDGYSGSRENGFLRFLHRNREFIKDVTVRFLRI